MTENRFKITSEISESIIKIAKGLDADSVFILTDTNTRALCLPLLDLKELNPSVIEIESGDENKNIKVLQQLWDTLIEQGATRHSLLINIGGGVVCDIGGFAAATLKRGMPFINIPTTLLAAADATIGGKTGINYRGYKNEIGVFAEPIRVLIDCQFFDTLSYENRLSGFAEIIKHSLISDSLIHEQTLGFDIEKFDLKKVSRMLQQSLEMKQSLVELDPTEKGKRRTLNLGHTLGHGFETLSYKVGSPLLHGYAVIWGLVGELYLSAIKLKLNKEVVMNLLYFAKNNYGAFPFTCDQYEEIYELLKHDKKNKRGVINFTLLAGVGDVRINQTATKEEIFETLDFIREN